jgi:hypothetical protein
VSITSSANRDVVRLLIPPSLARLLALSTVRRAGVLPQPVQRKLS